MIHPSVKIHPTASIYCDYIEIGAGGQIGKNCVIEGHCIHIGREFWMDDGAIIGGGSCFDSCAQLLAGDFLHIGKGSQLNIGRGITIGDEVGIRAQLFTHGAYLNELDGFPVQFQKVTIGSNIWIPNALIHPGSTVGSNVVVAAGSVINSDIPSNCFAAGSPARVIKNNYYPRDLPEQKQEVILRKIFEECFMLLPPGHVFQYIGGTFVIDEVCFDPRKKTIQKQEEGEPAVTEATEIVRNQFRRHGIRFRYSYDKTTYKSWK